MKYCKSQDLWDTEIIDDVIYLEKELESIEFLNYIDTNRDNASTIVNKMLLFNKLYNKMYENAVISVPVEEAQVLESTDELEEDIALEIEDVHEDALVFLNLIK